MTKASNSPNPKLWMRAMTLNLPLRARALSTRIPPRHIHYKHNCPNSSLPLNLALPVCRSGARSQTCSSVLPCCLCEHMHLGRADSVMCLWTRCRLHSFAATLTSPMSPHPSAPAWPAMRPSRCRSQHSGRRDRQRPQCLGGLSPHRPRPRRCRRACQHQCRELSLPR